jgi:DNA-directed RNA polymerase beta' subunit
MLLTELGSLCLQVQKALQKITNEDWRLCPFRKSARISVGRPEWLLHTKLQIPPPNLWSSPQSEMTALKEVLAENKKVKKRFADNMKKDPERAPAVLAQDLQGGLQTKVRDYFGSKGTVRERKIGLQEISQC